MEIRYEKAFFQIVSFLERIERELGIKYYLVGGILVSIYSETRTTKDIDFVVDIYSVNHNIDTYIELLKKNDFYPIQDWDSASEIAKDIQLLQFFDNQQVIKFDNYFIDQKSLSKYKRIGPIGLKRRVRINFGGLECWVTSKEDYVLSKLVFGGWQDYTDALGCWLRFHEELDRGYLEKISKELEIQREYGLLKSGIDDPDEFFNKLKGI
ncbi:MAG: hypothetical protein HWN81_23425 [Candidatus Lokiarchaeota archaeon]|nr:hypothetical protein [Candidatus Lokiarchaeota archaeon]